MSLRGGRHWPSGWPRFPWRSGTIAVWSGWQARSARWRQPCLALPFHRAKSKGEAAHTDCGSCGGPRRLSSHAAQQLFRSRRLQGRRSVLSARRFSTPGSSGTSDECSSHRVRDEHGVPAAGDAGNQQGPRWSTDCASPAAPLGTGRARYSGCGPVAGDTILATCLSGKTAWRRRFVS